ncbi:hypothetical protein HK405_004864 [Cladochytrium tenue]|nr:hypothetical protein HK405_004864 [Cladochytrium tenue]
MAATAASSTSTAHAAGLHPGVARDLANNTRNTQPLSAGAPQRPEGAATKQVEDMYPAVIRAIENTGTDAQRDALHKLEHTTPAA